MNLSVNTSVAIAAGSVGQRHSPQVLPALKTPIALRVDDDVLARLKAQCPGNQGRINALLRQAMENSHGNIAKTMTPVKLPEDLIRQPNILRDLKPGESAWITCF
jgi:hypothetical protein